jgi:hypothetical protein
MMFGGMHGRATVPRTEPGGQSPRLLIRIAITPAAFEAAPPQRGSLLSQINSRPQGPEAGFTRAACLNNPVNRGAILVSGGKS